MGIVYEKYKRVNKDSWATPKWLMEIFGDWFDPCPLNDNPNVNGLNIVWKDFTYVNPPYSSPIKWVEKAIYENKKGKTIALLLKVDTSTKWYMKLVEANAHIIFIHKRLRFRNPKGNNDEKKPAGFPSMIAILSKAG